MNDIGTLKKPLGLIFGFDSDTQYTHTIHIHIE